MVVNLSFNMQVLKDEISTPKRVGDNYFTVVPFTATSPSGRLLNYQAECTVTDVGKASVEVHPRK